MISVETFVLFALIYLLVNSVCRIVVGCLKWEKPTKYETGDAVLGIITFFVFLWMLLCEV